MLLSQHIVMDKAKHPKKLRPNNRHQHRITRRRNRNHQHRREAERNDGREERNVGKVSAGPEGLEEAQQAQQYLEAEGLEGNGSLEPVNTAAAVSVRVKVILVRNRQSKCTH